MEPLTNQEIGKLVQENKILIMENRDFIERISAGLLSLSQILNQTLGEK